MDESYRELDDDGMVKPELHSDQRNGLPGVPPIMTFVDVVDWFCFSQEAFRAELSRIGTAEGRES